MLHHQERTGNTTIALFVAEKLFVVHRSAGYGRLHVHNLLIVGVLLFLASLCVIQPHQTAAAWGVTVTADEIREAKIKGNANNDWVCTYETCSVVQMQRVLMRSSSVVLIGAASNSPATHR